ncbi:N-acetyltransferase [Micromonospora aurantiaca]|uniref:N-acetyltransferase n=1 Tax=Micromonospora aurantiaca (nom. illeg.) TaxID=47850 RepID=A0ABQ6UJN1_9ACTN|nr:N-acetyltransferase [Micromonospora aurantiaca]KAB1116858.1 N-acetyltransferase [Micromonospora aurantiaca]
MTPPETVSRRATSKDIDALSEVVADTLMAQPTAAWLVPDAAECPGVLLRYARLLLTRGLEEGQVATTDDHAAVAVWYSRLEPPAPAAVWVYDLQRLLGSHAARFALLHAYVDAVLPHTPHHYLAHLAARPGQSGAARALLDSYHRRLDAEGLPAYAEASGARPRESVFARLGYEPRSPVLLEPGGPALWRMWRPAPGDRRSDALPCRMRAHRSAMPLRRRAVPASPRFP